MNLISILMPVKNASNYLMDCIRSIQNQSHREWELIAINDHSSDESKQLLEDYASQDSRIQVLDNPGQGIIPALQCALAHSKGTFITRMDADDLMPEDRLEKMLESIRNTSSDTLVTGLVKYFSDQPISEGYLKYEDWLNTANIKSTQWQQIYRECVVASPNWMMHSEGLQKIGSFNDLKYPEDYHLTLKWYQNRFTIKTIPEITLHWREHPERTSRNSANFNQEAFFKLKINHFIHHDLRTDELVLWGRNEKTRLAAKVLEKSGISYHQFDMNNFHQTETMESPQVLVGVYPDPKERTKIEVYLSNLSLAEGKDWWYI